MSYYNKHDGLPNLSGAEELAAELVTYYDTDELGKIPQAEADKLRALFMATQYHDVSELLDPSSLADDSRLWTLIREAVAAKDGIDGGVYTVAAMRIADEILHYAHALADSEADKALREAYDEANPEPDEAKQDYRERVRELV
jgi:hypothetical protein